MSRQLPPSTCPINLSAHTITIQSVHITTSAFSIHMPHQPFCTHHHDTVCAHYHVSFLHPHAPSTFLHTPSRYSLCTLLRQLSPSTCPINLSAYTITIQSVQITTSPFSINMSYQSFCIHHYNTVFADYATIQSVHMSRHISVSTMYTYLLVTLSAHTIAILFS